MFEIGQELTLEQGRLHARSFVRGWKEGSYLLVDIPDKGWNTRDPSEMIARMFHEGAYHGFTTYIMGAYLEIGLMALQYPDETIDTSYRESERFPVTVPMTIYRTVGDKVAEWEGVITDISKNGCQLMCQRSMHIDSVVFLRGHFTDASGFETIGCVIKSRDIRAGQYLYGVRFEITSDSDKEALDGFFEKLRAYKEAEHAPERTSNAPKIPPGARSQIQISGTRYNSILRGEKFPRYALLDIPLDKGRPLVVSHHADVIVRFEYSGVIYGFESQVIKQYTSPYALWVIQYPEEIQSVNLRRSHRITTLLLGKLVLNGRKSEGAIVDLSEGGGMFITFDEGLKEGQRALLELTLPSGEILEGLSCLVKSVKRKGDKTLVGLLFHTQQEDKYPTLLSYYLSCAQLLF